MAGFSASLHPRAQGGKFTQTVGGVQLPASVARLYQKYGASSTTLGFSGGAGTGYGTPGGDARVAYVQQLLNKLGFRDGSGKSLAADGKLGPLTTQAVMAAQRKVGVPADGKVTPGLVARLLKLPAAKGTAARSRLGHSRQGGHGHGRRGGTEKVFHAKAPKRARSVMSRKHY